MKKLLVLALVLSMATMASAALQLSINGDKEATEITIDLVPSGTVTLDIWTDTQIAPQVGEGYWAIGAQVSGARTSGGVSLFTAEGGIAIFADAVADGIVLPAGENGVYGVIGLATLPSIAAGATIYDLITLHCEGPGDVIVTLYADADSNPFAVDSVIIHQVPEPITMALLGLGGLFLRRRK